MAGETTITVAGHVDRTKPGQGTRCVEVRGRVVSTAATAAVRGERETEIVEYDPDAAYDAWMRSRETEADRELDAAAVAALNAQPAATAVQFKYEGERCWAIRTGTDEFVIRHEPAYDPRAFGF